MAIDLATTRMTVPFLDLRVESAEERGAYLAAIDRILQHGRILNGPELTRFEEAVAQYCGTPYAVGVSSGTAAVFLAVRSLGIGAGDEVILPALSFVGSASAVALTGAKPVFVDIGEDMLIDPAAAERAITARTKAIMPVQFTGAMCRMAELEAIARKRGVTLIEDAAPAFGAMRDGRKAGSFGPVGALSMNPMKVLNALGEAGVVLCHDAKMRQNLEELRYHGMVNKEFCRAVTFNGRMDTIQAAVLLQRLSRIEDALARRRAVAAAYARGLAEFVQVPPEPGGTRNVYYTYTVQTPQRDALKTALDGQGIETKIYHAQLMPEHPVYAGAAQGSFPVGREVVRRVLCLPIHEKMPQAQVDYVIAAVRRFFETRRNA
jgi:dTDP-4-amino-4,6-dideoxygalactose transaminase